MLMKSPVRVSIANNFNKLRHRDISWRAEGLRCCSAITLPRLDLANSREIMLQVVIAGAETKILSRLEDAHSEVNG